MCSSDLARSVWGAPRFALQQHRMSAVEQSRPSPTLLQIFLMCLRIGTTGFGGGTQSWLYREAVEKRSWMTDQQFLAGFTVAQVLPGANPVNVALYVGLELGGGAGAVLAVLGLVGPAFCVILALGALYHIVEA